MTELPEDHIWPRFKLQIHLGKCNLGRLLATHIENSEWLRDILALGAFLRAAREAHEVSSSQCQMTEASKANATALPPA